jgi:hypothetical protein
MQLRETRLGECVDGQRGYELLICGRINLSTAGEIFEQFVTIGNAFGA